MSSNQTQNDAETPMNSEEIPKPTTKDIEEPSSAEVSYMLAEFQHLYTLHQGAKDEGDKRLNFYITLMAAIGTVIVATGYFNPPDNDTPPSDPYTYMWLLLGGALFTFLIGLITFRKMLQRREATIIYRRRLARISAWFVDYYPNITRGIPYGISQDIPIDWGKYRFGSTASSVMIINCFILAVIAFFLIIEIASKGNVTMGLIVGILVAGLSWYGHLRWKWHWMKRAEKSEVNAMRKLDAIAKKHLG